MSGKANDSQVGGNHYKSQYQHWDLVLELKLDYLTGCATKYISRHRKKNGLQDLEKARHYLEKLQEEQKTFSSLKEHEIDQINLFVKANDLTNEERNLVRVICCGGGMTEAIILLQDLMLKYKDKTLVRSDNTGQNHPFGYKG